LQQEFYIGLGLVGLVVPPGATRLFLSLHDGYEWSNNVGSVDVTITPGPTCSPGDVDCDGDVDGDDLGILAFNYTGPGATEKECTQGDFDGDGDVDGDDLGILAYNYTGPLAVPEPAPGEADGQRDER